MLRKPTVWVLTAIHCAFLYSHMVWGVDLGMIANTPEEVDLIEVTTPLLVFFLVFFSGNCYTRYFAFYEACMGMQKTVSLWTGLVRVFFPSGSAKQLWNLSRHAIASVYLLYFEFGAGVDGATIGETEWAIIFRTGLLSEDERSNVMQYGGPKWQLSLKWAHDAMLEQLSSKDMAKAEDAAIGPFEEQLIAMRKHGGALVNARKMPVPFPYYHTLM